MVNATGSSRRKYQNLYFIRQNRPTLNKHVYLKSTFDDNLRMERLCSVFYGEAKRVIQTTGNSGRFYVTVLKTFKRDFGNPYLISHAKLKLLFDQPQIKALIVYPSDVFINNLK